MNERIGKVRLQMKVLRISSAMHDMQIDDRSCFHVLGNGRFRQSVALETGNEMIQLTCQCLLTVEHISLFHPAPSSSRVRARFSQYLVSKSFRENNIEIEVSLRSEIVQTTRQYLLPPNRQTWQFVFQQHPWQTHPIEQRFSK